MDALGRPNKEPIRSALPKKQSPKYLIPLFSIGMIMIFGCGLLWVVSGELDCTKEQKTIEPQQCNDISFMNKYLPIGIVIGLAFLPLAIISSLGSDEKPKTEQVK